MTDDQMTKSVCGYTEPWAAGKRLGAWRPAELACAAGVSAPGSRTRLSFLLCDRSVSSGSPDTASAGAGVLRLRTSPAGRGVRVRLGLLSDRGFEAPVIHVRRLILETMIRTRQTRWSLRSRPRSACSDVCRRVGRLRRRSPTFRGSRRSTSRQRRSPSTARTSGLDGATHDGTPDKEDVVNHVKVGDGSPKVYEGNFSMLYDAGQPLKDKTPPAKK